MACNERVNETVLLPVLLFQWPRSDDTGLHLPLHIQACYLLCSKKNSHNNALLAFHFQNVPIEKALRTTIVTKDNLNIITLSGIKVIILVKKVMI